MKLTKEEVDTIVSQSREADEGPTGFARRVEQAVLAKAVKTISARRDDTVVSKFGTVGECNAARQALTGAMNDLAA